MKFIQTIFDTVFVLDKRYEKKVSIVLNKKQTLRTIQRNAKLGTFRDHKDKMFIFTIVFKWKNKRYHLPLINEQILQFQIEHLKYFKKNKDLLINPILLANYEIYSTETNQKIWDFEISKTMSMYLGPTMDFYESFYEYYDYVPTSGIPLCVIYEKSGYPLFPLDHFSLDISKNYFNTTLDKSSLRKKTFRECSRECIKKATCDTQDVHYIAKLRTLDIHNNENIYTDDVLFTFSNFTV